MEVTISRQANTCITKDIDPFELGQLTVFAGENNSGKTHLMKALKKELTRQGCNVVHIPSERILVAPELETGAKDPLTADLGELIDVVFDSAGSISNTVDDISILLPSEFQQYGVENMSIKVKTSSPNDEDYLKAIRAVRIKKLIDSIVVKDGYCDVDDIDPAKIGQGTQRMIVVSLLRYLQRKKTDKAGMSDSPTYLIFEEPEIYLHPKLKSSLYSLLQAIAKDPRLKTSVILTTHDPHFVELGRDNKIYKVFRDPSKDYSTQISPVGKDILPYLSPAEINYVVFDQSSPTYFVELYEYRKTEAEATLGSELKYFEFDKQLSKTITVPQDQKDDKGHPVTFITRLRHDLAHPATTSSVNAFEARGKEAILKLRQ